MAKLEVAEKVWGPYSLADLRCLEMGLEVVAVESTPNPNAQKFVLRNMMFAQPSSFFDTDSAARHSVASRLFAIKGVESVLLLNDFITVNKTATAKWSELTRKVKQTLAELPPGEDSAS